MPEPLVDLPPIVGEHVIPIFGVLIAGFLYLAPWVNLRKAIAAGDLGPINPVPFCAAFMNALTFMIYSFFQDFGLYLFLANFFGLASLYFAFESHRIATPEVARRMKIVFFGLSLALGVLGTVILAADLDYKTYVGYFGFSITMSMFAAPLSTIASAVSNKDASVFDLPLLAATALCSISWAAYGLILADINIYFPNMFGLFTVFVQVGLCCVFPRDKPVASGPASSSLISNPELKDVALKDIRVEAEPKAACARRPSVAASSEKSTRAA